MSFFVCGSFVSDLHLVPFFEIFGVPRLVGVPARMSRYGFGSPES